MMARYCLSDNSLFDFLFDNLCKRVQATVSSAIPWQVDLHGKRKEAEQASWRKPVSSSAALSFYSAPLDEGLELVA